MVRAAGLLNVVLGSDSSIGVSGGFSGLYPYNYLMVNSITGGHAVTKVGAGQLQIVSGTCNFTNLTVAAGDFQMDTQASCWGTGTTPLVQSGATLDLNGSPTNGRKTLTINGNGYHDKDFVNIGALVNTGMRWFTDYQGVVHGPYVAGGSNLSVVLGSDSTIGVITPSDLKVGAISGNYSLTKTGSGTVIASTPWGSDHDDGVPGAGHYGRLHVHRLHDHQRRHDTALRRQQPPAYRHGSHPGQHAIRTS